MPERLPGIRAEQPTWLKVRTETLFPLRLWLSTRALPCSCAVSLRGSLLYRNCSASEPTFQPHCLGMGVFSREQTGGNGESGRSAMFREAHDPAVSDPVPDPGDHPRRRIQPSQMC